MSLAEQRSAFVRAHHTWEAGDFDGFLSLLADDIVYIVNVDGLQVPYAMSAVGKTDVQDRLQLLLDTFVVTKFAIEMLVHEADHSRSLVHGVYRHRQTGEILDIRLRFRAWVENGLLTRMEEIHDARFIEAFERFVVHIQNTAQGRSGC
jgi:ketosteroid isomerase-like protein